MKKLTCDMFFVFGHVHFQFIFLRTTLNILQVLTGGCRGCGCGCCCSYKFILLVVIIISVVIAVVVPAIAAVMLLFVVLQ